MNNLVQINKKGDRRILIIYTGGTFGMVKDESGSLTPFDFGQIVERIPELQTLDILLSAISFPTPLDSSNIDPSDWQHIAQLIDQHYSAFDAFVILHGTDTMAYTASALSYMLVGLNKPVILTGAQMPIGSVRSDARENLITALEIASITEDGHPIVSEVCLYFNFVLLRGNRAQKIRSSQFAAFESENYPYLAEAGIEIEFNRSALMPHDKKAELKIQTEMAGEVAVLKMFPGITEAVVRGTIFATGVEAVVLESYGSGNVMTAEWFSECLEEAIASGKIVLNVSQCLGGEVVQGKYETSKRLSEIGVLSGGDITTEAAVTKLMFLMAREPDRTKLKELLQRPLVGEMDG